MGKERAQVNMDWDKRIWKLARKTFPRAQDDQAEGSGEFSFVCLFYSFYFFLVIWTMKVIKLTEKIIQKWKVLK